MRTGIREHIKTCSGVFYRMKFLAEADDILGPARAPEGRSHRDGQRALYLSATPEGTAIATRIYVRHGDAPRAIFPLRVTAARIVDLRDRAATDALGIDTTHRAIDWQTFRAKGLPSPTWDIADRVRALGLDGMLYASRTDQRLTHLTLFNWNSPDAPKVTLDAPPCPWTQSAADSS